MITIPTVCLNSGKRMPALGLGTWQANPGEVGEAVKTAIDIGYRLFDCAMLYSNECEIGEAIREKISDGTVRRDELFIITKLWNTFHEKEQVVPTCRQSLKNFGLDYLDLYLIHWPVAQKKVGELNVSFPFANAEYLDYDYVNTWRGMEECVQLGLTKTIGLSNFNSKQVDRVVESATIKPVVNEIEAHPLLNQKKLIKFCQARSIEVIAYSPFASPTRPWAKPDDPTLSFEDPRLVEIAKKHNKTTAQVILRYIVQNGAVPIPKSVNKKRLIENADVFNFCLDPKDMEILDSFDCNGRIVPAAELKGAPHYPFNIEF